MSYLWREFRQQVAAATLLNQHTGQAVRGQTTALTAPVRLNGIWMA